MSMMEPLPRVGATLVLIFTLPAVTLGISNKERQELLDAHNKLRRIEVNVRGAVGLHLMEWDNKLEDFANKYVKNCLFSHSEDADRNAAGRSKDESVGENLYLTSANRIDNFTSATEMWYNEYEFYTYDTLTCKPGKMCGHYTQVVWDTTYRVGCGVRTCKGMGTFLSCNYAPAGNFVGRHPYSKGGTPCGNCPPKFPGCFNQLCAKAGAKEPKVPPPNNLAIATPRGNVLAGYLSGMWVIFLTSIVSVHGQ